MSCASRDRTSLIPPPASSPWQFTIQVGKLMSSWNWTNKFNQKHSKSSTAMCLMNQNGMNSQCLRTQTWQFCVLYQWQNETMDSLDMWFFVSLLWDSLTLQHWKRRKFHHFNLISNRCTLQARIFFMESWSLIFLDVSFCKKITLRTGWTNYDYIIVTY